MLSYVIMDESEEFSDLLIDNSFFSVSRYGSPAKAKAAARARILEAFGEAQIR